jgi:hypothetical protein
MFDQKSHLRVMGHLIDAPQNVLKTQGLFTLERVGSSPKAQVVPRLEDEGHWKRGTFPKTRKLEMGCGSNFRCKIKKKGHGPLSRWADFFKVEVSIWTLFRYTM